MSNLRLVTEEETPHAGLQMFLCTSGWELTGGEDCLSNEFDAYGVVKEGEQWAYQALCPRHLAQAGLKVPDA